MGNPFWIPALMTVTHHHHTLQGVNVIQLQQWKGYPHMYIAWAWRRVGSAVAMTHLMQCNASTVAMVTQDRQTQG